jgi:cytochrome c oxidase subunit 2
MEALRRGRVDPLTLHLQGEFMEDNLGSAQQPDGSITVRMIAQQYVFVPRCVLVPAGVPVHFRVTSADVVHLLTISTSHDALKVVPGRVSEATFQFDRPGDYKLPCREFCGAGHYAMRGEMVVVPREQFRPLAPTERVNCVAR